MNPIKWAADLFAGIWPKIALAAAFVGLVLLAVLRLIGIGRDQERGKAAIKGMARTQQANVARAKASQPITPEEEANDPYNRDAR